VTVSDGDDVSDRDSDSVSDALHALTVGSGQFHENRRCESHTVLQGVKTTTLCFLYFSSIRTQFGTGCGRNNAVSDGQCRRNQLSLVQAKLCLQPHSSFYPYLPHLVSDLIEMRYNRSAQNAANRLRGGRAVSKGVNVTTVRHAEGKERLGTVCVLRHSLCHLQCSMQPAISRSNLILKYSIPVNALKSYFNIPIYLLIPWNSLS